MIETLERAGVDANREILTPLTHGSGFGRFAKEVDESNIPTTSQSHDHSVSVRVNEWLDGFDKHDLDDGVYDSEPADCFGHSQRAHTWHFLRAFGPRCCA